MRQTQKVKNLCETALFIAIVFLGVFIIKFPGPFGYAHIGDSMIFLSVLMLGGKRGAAAGGLGAAVADIVSGYTIWALPTFICKAIMALLMGFMIKRCSDGRLPLPRVQACSSRLYPESSSLLRFQKPCRRQA